MRQCNAVAREVREMEKREKNIILFNVPEANEGEEDDGKRRDRLKVGKILQDLGLGEIQPIETRRIGKTGRYPRKIQVLLASGDECDKIVKKGREGPTLDDNVFITKDRTFNQRQEARLFRVEKEKEEEEERSQPERGRGRGRGRPRGRGNYGRGRGSRTSGAESRKRRNSGEGGNEDDDESKRRRTGKQDGGAATGGGATGGGATGGGATGGGATGGGATGGGATEGGATSSSSNHATTSGLVNDSDLGAVGGLAHGNHGNF